MTEERPIKSKPETLFAEAVAETFTLGRPGTEETLVDPESVTNNFAPTLAETSASDQTTTAVSGPSCGRKIDACICGIYLAQRNVEP